MYIEVSMPIELNNATAKNGAFVHPDDPGELKPEATSSPTTGGRNPGRNAYDRAKARRASCMRFKKVRLEA